MKIKSILGKNVKGRAFRFDAQPVNVIVGANARGKTAVMVAIDLALRPKLAPANYPAVAPLFEGFPDMVVSVQTNRGEFRREFAVKGEGITMNRDFRPEGINVPSVALNADEYFGLSIEKRANFVAAMVALPDTFNEQAVLAELKNRLKVEHNTEDTQSIVNSILGDVDESTSIIRSGGVSVQNWLAGQITSAEGRKKVARDTKQRMEKSGQASVQIQIEQPGDDTAEAITSIEAAIKSLRSQAAELNEKLGKVKADKDADLGARKKRAAKRSSLTKELEQFNDRNNIITELSKQLAEAKAAGNDYVSDTPGLTDLVSTLENQLRDFKDKETHRLADKQTKLISDSRIQKEKVERLMIEISDLEKSIKKLSELPSCPTCKASSPDWRKAASDSMREIVNWKMSEMEKAQSLFEQLVLQLRAIGTEIEGVTSLPAYTKLKQDIVLNENVLGLSVLRDQARDAQFRKSLDIQNQLTAAQNHQKLREQVQKELSELVDEPADQPSRAYDNEIANIESEVAKKTDVFLKLQERLKKASAAAQQNARKAQEEAARSKAESDYELQHLAVEVLKEFLAKMVTAAFTKLLADANLIADCILSSPLSYKDGEIGRYDAENRWISHRCFSGTEQAATYAAMSFALASTSDCRIVRVDELGRLDPSNKKKFIERMVQLVCDGKVDQVFCVDTVPEPYNSIEGVNLITI